MLDNQDKTNVDKKGLPFTVRTVFISEYRGKPQKRRKRQSLTGTNSRPEQEDQIDSRLPRLDR